MSNETIVLEKDSEVFTAMTGDKLKPGFTSRDFGSDKSLVEYVNRKLEAQPLITDACDKFIQVIKDEKREDTNLVMAKLRVNDLGVLVKKDGSPIMEDTAYLKILSQSWTQLTRQAPASVEKRLKSNVNAWLGRKQATVVGRTFKPGVDSRTMFSLVSQRYQAHDADDIAAEIAKADLPEGCRGTIKYLGDGGRFEIDAALGRPVDIDGDFHQIIVSVRSSDNGTLGQSVFFKAHRLKCANGIFVAQSALISRTRHTGELSTLRDQFSLGLARATDAMDAFKVLWHNAKIAKFLCAKTGEQLNGPEALARLAIHKQLMVPSIRAPKLLESLMGAYDKEPGDSIADVLNAATRTAHESVDHFRSQWFGNDLEDQAGVLLAGNHMLNPIAEEVREKMGLG